MIGVRRPEEVGNERATAPKGVDRSTSKEGSLS